MAKVNWDNASFETIVEESGQPITFDNPGVQYVGIYTGKSLIVPPDSKGEDDNWTQLNFRDQDGNLHTLNAGAKLLQAFEAIAEGQLVRITRMEDVPMTDPGKNPMKDFRVEVATG